MDFRRVGRVLRACAVALSLSTLALAPAQRAQAATPEEEAGLMLFKEGRAAFGAGEYETALQHFINAKAMVDNIFVAYYLARTYAAMGQCEQALPGLAAMAGKLPEDAEIPRKEDERRCMLILVRRYVRTVDCQKALPLLMQLSGRVVGADEAWRAEKVPWCQARITDFLTDTPVRRAAYKLYTAAKQAERTQDLEKAAALYTKALALVDDPVLRRSLAWVLTETSDCHAVGRILGGIPQTEATDRDQALAVACTRYGSGGLLEGRARRDYLADVASGLEARATGDKAAAAAIFAAAASKGRNPALAALYIDLLFELRRCGDYVGAAGGAAEAVTALVQDREERVERCESGEPFEDEEPAVAASTGQGDLARGGTDAGITKKAPVRGSKTLAWSLVGGGGVAILAAAGFAMARSGNIDDLAAAEKAFNEGSADEAVGAYSTITEHQDAAAQNGTLGWTFAVLGLGAAATGGVMLWMNPSSPAEPGSDRASTSIVPFFTPRVVGIQGRF